MEAAKKKDQPVLMPEFFGNAEHKQNNWVADLPMKVSLEDALEPSYWAHVAEQMQPLDEIKLRAEDGSWVAYLIVTMCGRNYARVALDRKIELGEKLAAPVTSIKHRVEWKGPKNKWCVIRIADSKMVREGEPSELSAANWLQDHERTVGV